MRVILDTDKKTITVPWNYEEKLEEMNKLIMEVTNGDESKKKEFIGYLTECWDEAIKGHVDKANKPKKPEKKKKNTLNDEEDN